MPAWRARIFVSTWLAYAGFYFCRRPFYAVKSTLGEERGWDASTLGTIGMVYLLAYAVGQFASGALGTRFGPRLVLLAGMALSIAASVGFGLSGSLAVFVLLMALNGLAQATGWSTTVGTMAQWFPRTERGSVMGVWSTCYQLGPIAATALAAWMLVRGGYDASFFAGAAVLAIVWVVVIVFQRDRPEDVGLPGTAEEREAAGGGALSRQAWIDTLLVGTFYFFLKLIRYALWSWTPFFLERSYGLAADDAGYLSNVFDVAGVVGVITAGFVSDRFFASRRAIVSLALVALMTVACMGLQLVGTVTGFAICVAVIGFSLFGPDSLMSGAGAMDIGSRRGALLAAAVINGMGSLGPVVQEVVIGRLFDASEDLGPVFALLFGSSLCALAFLAVVVVRARRGTSNV
jgi:OPA family glycerol-3-phosphate transporter-like MFS transporter